MGEKEPAVQNEQAVMAGKEMVEVKLSFQPAHSVFPSDLKAMPQIADADDVKFSLGTTAASAA